MATARQRELTLRWERPDAPLPIWADAKELGKVVRNLISNAVKFTPAGGEVEILLEAPQASGEVDWVQLSVRDTGIDMDEDAQRKIFKPFFQADSSSTRAFEGTGIGLALVKAIVVRHEGEIAVASKPGVGTTMTVTLPRAPAEAEKLAQLEGAAEAELAELPDAEARFSSPSQAIYVDDDAYEDEEPESVGPVLEVLEGGAASRPDDASIPIPEATRLVQEHVDREIFRRARIVLIDDQPNILRLLERILSPHHDVVTADDGAAGLARVLETRPNLVISDVMMPRMNGFQLVHELRSNPTTERIPVLLLTARADGSDRVRGLRGGANDYLVKPFEPAELKARVRNLLRQHYYETYLTRLNEDRRAEEARITGEAIELTLRNGMGGDDTRAIVLACEGWHPGVIGIVCSRLVERYHKPTILLNRDGDQLQGSGRSIDGFNLHGALVACAGHLTKFGGHDMAAGLAMDGSAFEGFVRDFLAHAEEHDRKLDAIVGPHKAQFLELLKKVVRELA